MKMNSPLLAELHRDHVNIMALMGVADRVLRAIELDDDPDYELLEDVLLYLTSYSDAHHHPNEDVVFAALHGRVPEAASKIDTIEAEHDFLVSQGKRVLDGLGALKEEAILSRRELVHAARDYFAALQRHMSFEESVLFPLADRSLTDDDWHAVRERILTGADPLFGPAKDANFRRLWERIEAHKQTA